MEWVKAQLHSIHDQPDATAVHAQFDRVVDALTDKLPRSASTWRLPAPGPGQGFFKPRPGG